MEPCSALGTGDRPSRRARQRGRSTARRSRRRTPTGSTHTEPSARARSARPSSTSTSSSTRASARRSGARSSRAGLRRLHVAAEGLHRADSSEHHQLRNGHHPQGRPTWTRIRTAPTSAIRSRSTRSRDREHVHAEGRRHEDVQRTSCSAAATQRGRPSDSWDFDHGNCVPASASHRGTTPTPVTVRHRQLGRRASVHEQGRGSIVIERNTGAHPEVVRSTSRRPPAPRRRWTLTTTGPASWRDSETFSDLAPGTYGEARTVPDTTGDLGFKPPVTTAADVIDAIEVCLLARAVTCRFVGRSEGDTVPSRSPGPVSMRPRLPANSDAGVTFTGLGRGPWKTRSRS